MTAAIVDINGAGWTAITAAGESGTCWVQKNPGDGGVVINHIESVDPSSLIISQSYFMPDNKRKITDIVSDSPTDIFYARCVNEGETAKVAVDVV